MQGRYHYASIDRGSTLPSGGIEPLFERRNVLEPEPQQTEGSGRNFTASLLKTAE